jgi:hypothetical protein
MDEDTAIGTDQDMVARETLLDNRKNFLYVHGLQDIALQCLSRFSAHCMISNEQLHMCQYVDILS